MVPGISGVIGAVVEYALDGLSARHTAIAANIANANTPGYRPQRVSFEDQLASAGASATSVAGLPPAQTFSEAPVASGGARAMLDRELVELNRNVLQYQALIRGLEKYNATISAAINEGKR